MRKHTTLFSTLVGLTMVPSAARALDRDNTAPPRPLPPATSTHDAPPPAPNPIAGQSFGVVSQAGVGSNVAYARRGVVELGGGLSWVADNKMKSLVISPQAGWFVTDNLELSTLLQWELAGTRTERLAFLVEPSAHLPLADQVFVFLGLGAGVAYKSSDSVGLALSPRLGLNVLVGRSGILSPSLTFQTSTNRAETGNDGRALLAVNSRWNLNLGYSVMW